MPNTVEKIVCLIALGISLVICPLGVAYSQPLQDDMSTPEPSGGFFDKNYANEGFFDEPKPTASPTPQEETPPSPAATAATTSAATTEALAPEPTSAADTASEIYKRGAGAIDAVRSMNSNPGTQERLKQTLEGVRENLNQGLGIQSTSKSPRENIPNLTVATSAREIAEELSLGELTKPVELTLVVKAKPRAVLMKSLDGALLASKRGAKIKAVYIIGYSEELTFFKPLTKQDKLKMKKVLLEDEKDPKEQEKLWSKLENSTPSSFLLFDKLNLEKKSEPQVQLKELLFSNAISLSPALIVETTKTKKVFQGNYSPTEILDEQGRLVPELPEETRGGTQIGDLAKLKAEEQILTEFSEKSAPKAVEFAVERARGIKACTRPRVRRIKVGPATLGAFFSPDILVYAADDPFQAENAARYQGSKIAYKGGVPLIDASNQNPLTPFIVSLPIRCLPTHFRYTNEGPTQFMEMLQGDAAWGK